jgi:hypothetical protein
MSWLYRKAGCKMQLDGFQLMQNAIRQEEMSKLENKFKKK